MTASVHPGVDQLEAYVLDALDAIPARALEQHVRVCDRCAEALAAQARREVALGELVPRVSSARRPDRAPSDAGRSPFLMALAGALALVAIAADPRALPPSEGAPVLIAQAICQEPEISEASLLCLDDHGEAAICRPASSSMTQLMSPTRLFSCSGCSCPAEPPR